MSQRAIKTSSCWCGVIWSIFGVLLCIAGIVLLIIFRSVIFEDVIKQKIPLKVDSDGNYNEAGTKWATPTFTEVMQFWIFDVTNSQEVMYKGAKPRVIERGPYGFRQTDIKRNISYSDNGEWVTYKNYRTWYWWPKYSCPTCKMTDMVTVPNMVYLGAISSIMQMYPNGAGCKPTEDCADPLKLIDLALLLLGEGPFVKVQVGELLFTGYKDPMIAIEHIMKQIPSLQSNPFLKNAPDMKTMAFFYGYNGTDDGEYMVKTGLNDIDQVGQIVKWHGKESLDWWDSAAANKLRGSPDGSLFKPFLTTDDTLPIFLSYWCRPLDLIYEKKVKVRNLDAWRYVLPDDLFNNTLKKNADYLPKSGFVPPDGLMNVPCQPGRMFEITFATYYSAPHFTNCDPYVIDSIDGVHPNREAYQMGRWEMELITGSNMGVQFRLQINIPYKRNPTVTMMRNLREDPNLPENQTYIPLMWLNETAFIDDDTYNEIKDDAVVLYIGAYVGMGLAVLIGLLIFIFCCGCCFCRRRRKSDSLIRVNGQPQTAPTAAPRYINASQPIDHMKPDWQQRYDSVETDRNASSYM